jgi:tRNA (mo5U34)-methyltransferase
MPDEAPDLSRRDQPPELPDYAGLEALLSALSLPASLVTLARQRLSPAGHGDYEKWARAVASLVGLREQPTALKAALLELSPWRKGPFTFDDLVVDAEWKSDQKWARVAAAVKPLAGRRLLDVGCGNGYYALQMQKAGAAMVLGIDPTVLYVMQFLAVCQYTANDNVAVLPLRLHDLPAASVFDTAFSRGVLYHQRSPIDHLRQLRETLRPGGQLVLETLILPGEEPRAVTPPGRYANMKNVWLLPTASELVTWLERCNYSDIELVDITQTTADEQRRTEWMTSGSLADALNPDDPTLTIEGWPAPRRAILTASRK